VLYVDVFAWKNNKANFFDLYPVLRRINEDEMCHTKV